MSKENACIHVRLSEEEKERLAHHASICGLSQTEYLRQLCKGRKPKPQPPKEFWELLNVLYEIHGSLKVCAKFEPSALELCGEIETLVLKLQEVS